MTVPLAASAGVNGALLGPVGFIVALFVGTVSFFSPCILPLLPGYLSFVSGLSGEESEQTRAARRRTLLGIGLFVLGFATMFTALGAAAGVAGTFLLDHLTMISARLQMHRSWRSARRLSKGLSEKVRQAA